MHPDPVPAAPNDRRTHRAWLLAVPLVVLMPLLVRCATAPPPAPGDAFEVCGKRFDIGAPVLTWREPGGYDAYRLGPAFDPAAPLDGERRYGTRSGLADDASLADLQQVVHQFVLHFDACGTSRQCFKVLQDVRKLSVHFLLDVDGTIYQTLDLREKAHHATIANDGSIGVEIAHPGAWPQPLNADMRRWYEQDEIGWRMRFPDWIEHGVATPGFVARPARPEPIAGAVNGRVYHQFDFTEPQYHALAQLCAALQRVFPRIRLEAPRDASGRVVDHALSADALRAFDGIVGHFHVQQNKQDPGPAFQWDRVLDEARALRAAR
ncbi:MAG: N-acetylmuramoyl-L-alanine amidase [Planctomycetes bacterium]|nr:N-acetylmuramoyl-L-alanine amidase [Planctomycetota bacterium]